MEKSSGWSLNYFEKYITKREILYSELTFVQHLKPYIDKHSEYSENQSVCLLNRNAKYTERINKIQFCL